MPLANPGVPGDPTEALDLDFRAFVDRREARLSAHLIDGVPDYAFALDRRLRQRLTSIAPLRMLARAAGRGTEPMQQHLAMMNMVMAGPHQFPDLHRTAEACAALLGIGVPRVFVMLGELPNAFTFAGDDVRPSIYLTTRLVGALEPDELTAVIGHECGHVHNLHAAYHTLVLLLTEPVANELLRQLAIGGLALSFVASIGQVLGFGLRAFLLGWSRAAEITCDRAGAICAGGVRPMMRALLRIKTGGEHQLADFDLDSYVRQLDTVRSSPFRLFELMETHPLTHRRIAALHLFESSAVLRDWLPGLPAPDTPLLSQEELDTRCEEIVRILKRPFH